MTFTVARARTELVRFVLTWIDEDEAELRRLARDNARRGVEIAGDLGVRAVTRQLAGVEAKRRLIASLQRLIMLRDLPLEKPVRDEAILMLRALAAPYAHHRVFRDEWRIPSRFRVIAAGLVGRDQMMLPLRCLSL